MNEWEMLLRVVVAGLLGALIGYEREAHNKPAGVRTYMLVAVGSALVVAASGLVIGKGTGAVGDSTRIAAGVITGIGFLGAGAIMRGSEGVKGLTTAAGIWVTAAVGITVGYGLYILAIGGIVIAVIVVVVLRRIPGAHSERSEPS